MSHILGWRLLRSTKLVRWPPRSDRPTDAGRRSDCGGPRPSATIQEPRSVSTPSFSLSPALQKFLLTHSRTLILLKTTPPREQEMEESMSNERSTRATWRERLQMAAQIAALISCVCGMTIAFFAYQNSQRSQ